MFKFAENALPEIAGEVTHGPLERPGKSVAAAGIFEISFVSTGDGVANHLNLGGRELDAFSEGFGEAGEG